MGCVESTQIDAASKEATNKNRAITHQLRDAVEAEHRVKKLLLLGPGESGKSTIFKQTKVLFRDSYSEEERAAFRPTIHSNIIEATKTLIEDAKQRYGAKFPDSLNAAAAAVAGLQPYAALTPEMALHVKTLWESEAVQDSYANRSSFQLMDNAAAFLGDVMRCAEENYVPTVQDILQSRVRTTGIVETEFSIKQVPFRMIDVGGQRSERRKWIHCFENVDAVVFVAALSEFDQVLYEDPNKNRVAEALNLFSEICNSRFFVHTDMILFLNKRDLFAEKVQASPGALRECFPDFQGSGVDEGLQFMKAKFCEQNKYAEKKIFTHVTCATDSSNVAFVFDAVQSTIVSRNLTAVGLL